MRAPTRALLDVISDEKTKGMARRCKAINQFWQMLVDVPYGVMGLLVVLLAPWRWKVFFGQLELGKAEAKEDRCRTKQRRRCALCRTTLASRPLSVTASRG